MISISEHLQLQEICLNDQSKLLNLVTRIYTPVYKHLWKKNDCSWYLNKFYGYENLQKELSEKDSEYYFVVFKSQYVGILKIHFDKPLEGYKRQSNVYLHRIFLGYEAQGKGVGKALFDWIEKKTKAKDRTSIWLKAMDTQQQALRFYTKLGYENVGKTILDFELIKKDFSGMVIFWKPL